MRTIPIEIGWEPGGRFGWGLVALHLALGLARCGHKTYLPRGRKAIASIGSQLQSELDAIPNAGDEAERRVLLYANGNDCSPRPSVSNRFVVSINMFEDSEITWTARQRLSQFDLNVAASRWCQRRLARAGVQSVLWHQGYDSSLFLPRAKTDESNRFRIFSGGKLEFRKGQDLVVEAFRQFQRTPEGQGSLLVTAWQNPWPSTMRGVEASGHVVGMPVVQSGSADVRGWLAANGVAPSDCIDLGWQTQSQMAESVASCDVGFFPNRCEGGTNMVLTEALSLGLPCIMSRNTGHLDLGSRATDRWLNHQLPVPWKPPNFRSVEDWGESSIEECVSALRSAYSSRNMHRERTDPTLDDWSTAAWRLTEILDQVL